MTNYLTKILQHKQIEVAERKLRVPLKVLEAQLNDLEPARRFKVAMEAAMRASKPGVIAELKQASPSKGLIRSDFNVQAIAQDYEAHGATCLSVLTDAKFFKGQPEFLMQVKAVVELALLRKDFIIDEYQIVESRVLGADAVLLIAAALTDEQLTLFYRAARRVGLDVLIEVHTQEELHFALQFKSAIIGVNNRNLSTFETDIGLSKQLQKRLPRGRWLVSESGIAQASDIQSLRRAGVHAFLVGEALMRAPSPGAALKQLFQQ